MTEEPKPERKPKVRPKCESEFLDQHRASGEIILVPYPLHWRKKQAMVGVAVFKHYPKKPWYGQKECIGIAHYAQHSEGGPIYWKARPVAPRVYIYDFVSVSPLNVDGLCAALQEARGKWFGGDKGVGEIYVKAESVFRPPEKKEDKEIKELMKKVRSL